MSFFSNFFGGSDSETSTQYVEKEYALSMLEIKRLWQYPQYMRDEYAIYIKSCMTTHPEQRWEFWEKDHPSPYVYFPIAGINHRKGIKPFVGESQCLLVAEPDNPYDANAIRIEDYHEHVHLGYVPRDETDNVRSLVSLPCQCVSFIEQEEDYDNNKKYFSGRIRIEKKQI